MIITSKTKLCALIGNPVSHSLSPEMHNYSFKKLGLNYFYFALKVENLEYTMRRLKELEFAGANITIPYKVKIMDYLDWVEEEAAKVGAVNTIVNDDGILKGYNTDIEGFLEPLEETTGIKDKKVTLIGSGGAARAIAYAVSKKGGKLCIINRTEKKAKSLAKELSCRYGSLKMLSNLETDVLINSTPVGMYPNINDSVVPKGRLKNMIVYDIVYNPLETKLLKEAKEQGCKVIHGIDMLVSQGAKSFELWTGLKSPVSEMKDAAIKKLESK